MMETRSSLAETLRIHSDPDLVFDELRRARSPTPDPGRHRHGSRSQSAMWHGVLAAEPLRAAGNDLLDGGWIAGIASAFVARPAGGIEQHVGHDTLLTIGSAQRGPPLGMETSGRGSEHLTVGARRNEKRRVGEATDPRR